MPQRRPRAPGPPASGRAASDPEELLLDRLRDAHNALREILRATVERHDLIPTEYRTLAYAQRFGPPTPSILSHWLGITPASTTELIDRLERRGFLRRAAHPTDRRSVRLELTSTGRRTYRRARTAYRETVARVSRGMDPKRRADLSEGLREFQRAIETSALGRP